MLDAAARIIQPGVTTDEIDRVVHEATIAAGANFDKFHFWSPFQLLLLFSLVSISYYILKILYSILWIPGFLDVIVI